MGPFSPSKWAANIAGRCVHVEWEVWVKLNISRKLYLFFAKNGSSEHPEADLCGMGGGRPHAVPLARGHGGMGDSWTEGPSIFNHPTGVKDNLTSYIPHVINLPTFSRHLCLLLVCAVGCRRGFNLDSSRGGDGVPLSVIPILANNHACKEEGSFQFIRSSGSMPPSRHTN